MVLPWDATSMVASKATKAKAALGQGVEMYSPTNPTQHIDIPYFGIQFQLRGNAIQCASTQLNGLCHLTERDSI